MWALCLWRGRTVHSGRLVRSLHRGSHQDDCMLGKEQIAVMLYFSFVHLLRFVFFCDRLFLHSRGWPPTSDPTTSASWVLGLREGVTILRFLTTSKQNKIPTKKSFGSIMGRSWVSLSHCSLTVYWVRRKWAYLPEKELHVHHTWGVGSASLKSLDHD